MSSKRLYLFDFDGTIVDSLGVAVEAFNAVAPRLGCKQVTVESLPRVLEGNVADVMAEYGFKPWKLPFIVLGVRWHMKRAQASLQPHVGMLEAMKALRARGDLVGIVTTNSRRNVRNFLRAHQADDAVDFIDSAIHIFGKDVALKRVMAKAGVDASSTTYIGDEVRDVQAARKANVRSAVVVWGFQPRNKLEVARPDAFLETANDILSL